LSDDAPLNLRAVADYFGLIGTAPVEKDMHVVRAIRAVTSIDASPFSLVFGGGTALARAYKLMRRMSEDVDFKIVPLPAAPVSRNGLRRALGRLGDQVTQSLLAAGFRFNPEERICKHSQNENRYTAWQIPYDSEGLAEHGLRPTIQIELTYASLRLPAVTLPLSSFVAEVYQRPPEMAALSCVSVTQTAAEKLVALTRRTAMDLAGLSRDADPALVRHIYDLHMMRGHVDHGQVASMAREIAAADGQEFRNQYPAYYADVVSETGKALTALRTNPIYRSRYTAFVAAMVYGEQVGFDEALGTVTDLARQGLTTGDRDS
jgi:hypothetical protein